MNARLERADRRGGDDVRQIHNVSSWTKRFLASTVTLACIAVSAHAAKAQDNAPHFALSLGWTEGESGQHLEHGFKDAVAKYGGSLTVADAAYDAKRQSDQIDAFIRAKPAALFVTASDPAAIAPAIKRAIAAGIPVFASDSLIPGALVTTTAMSNNFGMGVYGADFIAQQLHGKGSIALVDLPANETWDLRADGFYWEMQQYPNIKVVGKWSYNSTGATTPRQGVEGLLTAHPDVQAIWCAWDGAAMAGALALHAAGKKDVFTVGIDGGQQVFNYIKSGVGVRLSMAQSFYTMAMLDVYYAHQFLEGHKAPRIIITPTYAVTQDMLKNGMPNDYDVPGHAEKLGWKRAL
jgi:ribose transport system substrate-binding protein